MALSTAMFGNLLNAPKSPEEYTQERQAAQLNQLNIGKVQAEVAASRAAQERAQQARNLLSGGAGAAELRRAGFLDEATSIETAQNRQREADTLDAAIAQGYQYLQDNPDLSQRDAVEFGRITGQLTLAQNRRQQLEGEMRQADQQYRDYEARQTQERVAKVAPQLAAIGLTPDKLQVVEQHLRACGAPQEAIDYLSGCSAPWAVVMAAESLMYRQLMAQRAKATTKVDNAKRSSVLTPGAASTPQSRPGNTVKRTHQRMVATGSVNDAVAHELALMERRTGSGTRRR